MKITVLFSSVIRTHRNHPNQTQPQRFFGSDRVWSSVNSANRRKTNVVKGGYDEKQSLELRFEKEIKVQTHSKSNNTKLQTDVLSILCVCVCVWENKEQMRWDCSRERALWIYLIWLEFYSWRLHKQRRLNIYHNISNCLNSLDKFTVQLLNKLEFSVSYIPKGQPNFRRNMVLWTKPNQKKSNVLTILWLWYHTIHQLVFES